MSKYTLDDFAQFIDHTNLKAFASANDIKKLCQEAEQYHFKMVAINQVQTKFCAEQLAGTGVHVGAAIAFPLGQVTIEGKVFEAKDAIKNGADEIDYVINITALKEKDYEYLENEMQSVVNICRDKNVISKVIFENCYLEKDEIRSMAQIALDIKPDFIKTSTGFGISGAKAEDVMLMKSVVGSSIKVKAAGKIRDAETFLAMIRAGAQRIGTSSGIKIINELKKKFADAGTDSLEI